MSEEVTYNSGFERYSKLLEEIKRKCTYGNLLGHVRDASAIIRKHYVLDNKLHVYLGEDSTIVSTEELCSKDENYDYDLRQGKSEIYMEFNERQRECQLRINGLSSIRIKYGEEARYSEILGKEGRDYYYLPSNVAITGMDKTQDQYEFFGEIPDNMQELLEAAVARSENLATHTAYSKALELHERAQNMLVSKKAQGFKSPVEKQPVNLEELSRDELVEYLENVKSDNHAKETDLRKRELIEQIEQLQDEESDVVQKIKLMESQPSPQNGFEKYSQIAKDIRALCTPENLLEEVEDSYSKKSQHFVLDGGLHVYLREGSVIIASEELMSRDGRFSPEEKRAKNEVFFELNEPLESCKLQFNKGSFDSGDKKIFYRAGGEHDYAFLPPDINVFSGERSLDKFVERGIISDNMQFILNTAIHRVENDESKEFYQKGLSLHEKMEKVLARNGRMSREEMFALSEEELIALLGAQKSSVEFKKEKLEKLELIEQIRAEMQIGLELDKKLKETANRDRDSK